MQTRRGGTEFQDVYDYAGCPFTLLETLTGRAAIRGFIKYLPPYEQNQRKKTTLNGELRTCERLCYI